MAQRRETVDNYFTGDFKDPQLFLVLFNYLEIRSMESLLLSETDLPVAILVPPTGITWGDSTFKYLEKNAENNANQLFAEAFDKSIESFEDLVAIFHNYSLQEIENVFRNNAVLNNVFKEFNSLEELIQCSSVDLSEFKKYSWFSSKMKNMAYINGNVQGSF